MKISTAVFIAAALIVAVDTFAGVEGATGNGALPDWYTSYIQPIDKPAGVPLYLWLAGAGLAIKFLGK